jgi:hypothetical protein
MLVFHIGIWVLRSGFDKTCSKAEAIAANPVRESSGSAAHSQWLIAMLLLMLVLAASAFTRYHPACRKAAFTLSQERVEGQKWRSSQSFAVRLDAAPCGIGVGSIPPRCCELFVVCGAGRGLG